MKCKKCDKELDVTDKLCAKCGTKVGFFDINSVPLPEFPEPVADVPSIADLEKEFPLSDEQKKAIDDKLEAKKDLIEHYENSLAKLQAQKIPIDMLIEQNTIILEALRK